MEGSAQSFKAVVLGASGAIGRELVKELCASPSWSEISVIVRRELDQWKTIPGKEKLKVVLAESLDSLEQADKWNFKGYDSLFCTLGGRTKQGEELFTKIDLTYPVWGAKVGLVNGLRHYSLCSSVGADHTSMFLYKRVKGQVENEIAKLGYNTLSIFRPGLLLNRENDDRFVEKFAAYIPFLPKIESAGLARAMRLEAEKALSQNLKGKFVYENQ